MAQVRADRFARSYRRSNNQISGLAAHLKQFLGWFWAKLCSENQLIKEKMATVG